MELSAEFKPLHIFSFFTPALVILCVMPHRVSLSSSFFLAKVGSGGNTQSTAEAIFSEIVTAAFRRLC